MTRCCIFFCHEIMNHSTNSEKGAEHMRGILILFLSSLFLVGCSLSSSVSEEQAKEIVIAHHTDEHGEPEIVTIEKKWGSFYVTWEKKTNFEGGIDKVSRKGEVKMVEAYIE